MTTYKKYSMKRLSTVRKSSLIFLIFILFILKHYLKNPMYTSIIYTLVFCLILSYLFVTRISFLSICAVLALLLTSPSLIGEHFGFIPFAFLLCVNIILIFQFIFKSGDWEPYSKSITGKSVEFGFVFFFLAGWVLQIVNSEIAIKEIVFIFNLSLFVFLLTKNSVRFLEIIKMMIYAVSGLNFVGIAVLILTPIMNLQPILFSGSDWGRGNFLYSYWTAGIITGGGASIISHVPRFVGLSGEPGLWSLVCLGFVGFTEIIKVVFQRRIVLVGLLIGVVISQSSAAYVISLFSISLSIIFLFKTQVTKLLGIIFSISILILFGSKFVNQILSFKVRSGEIASLRDRGIGLQGVYVQSDFAFSSINYLKILFSMPLIGIMYIISAFIVFAVTIRSKTPSLILSSTAITLGAMFSQPIQFHPLFFLIQILICIMSSQKSAEVSDDLAHNG